MLPSPALPPLPQLATVAASLPVTSAEAGDTWMTSTTADCWKITFYREAARAYAECVRSGQCDIHDPRVLGFSRLLIKIPEHTCVARPRPGDSAAPLTCAAPHHRAGTAYRAWTTAPTGRTSK